MTEIEPDASRETGDDFKAALRELGQWTVHGSYLGYETVEERLCTSQKRSNLFDQWATRNHYRLWISINAMDFFVATVSSFACLLISFSSPLVPSPQVLLQ